MLQRLLQGVRNLKAASRHPAQNQPFADEGSYVRTGPSADWQLTGTGLSKTVVPSIQSCL